MIDGTLGEKHLTELRGIPVPTTGGWPEAIRWHAGDRAIVAAATDNDGEVRAVHRIFLNADGTNVLLPPDRKGRRRKKKLTRGPRAAFGAVVRLPGPADKPLQLAEGLETGLSGWRSSGFETWILLGPLSGAKMLPRGRVIILLCDDDAPGSPADRALQKSLTAWRKDGLNIQCATPWAVPRFDKSDFNDLLRETGSLDAARERIHLAVLAAHGLKPAPAPFPLPTAAIAAVRGKIGRGIANFFARRANDTAPPRALLAGPTGSGKTEMVGRELPQWIEDHKAQGRPHRGIIMVPAHRLGHQICERYQALGVNAAVYQGRGDPFGEASALCQNMTEVRLATIAQEEITTAVCINTKQKIQCPFFADCKYFEQLTRAIAADVVIVAHNFIFQPAPQKLLENVGFVIIEEDFTTLGDGTVEHLPITTFDQEHLNQHPVLHGEDRGHTTNYSATADLIELYRKIERVLTMAAEGQSTVREALRTVALTAAEIATARKLTWRRQAPRKMYPAMPLSIRRKIADRAAHHLSLPRIATVLHALETLAKGAARPPDMFADDDTGNGAFAFDGVFVNVYRLKEVTAWLTDLPILIPSASARPDLVERFFQGIELVQPPAPAIPHQTVHQRLGAFGKAATKRKLAELVTAVRLKATVSRQVLVIVHMDHEHAFAGIPGVSTLHHGDVAGDDDYGTVDAVFQIGGPFAQPTQIARQASAEAGQLVSPAKPITTPCTGLLTDGSGVQFERLAYADSRLQRVHAGIYDQSFLQGGLGRGRGINRTAANPLEIFIYGNVPLSVPVHSIERWKRPSRLTKMALAGFVPLNAADMARFYPELFRSPASAAQAIHRWGGRAAMVAEIKRLTEQFSDAFDRVTFQPEGQGFKAREAIGRRRQLHEWRERARREFAAGLAAWSATPFTLGRPAAPSLWTADESDISGKRTLFPEMSESSSAVSQETGAAAGAWPADQPRAPPDG